MKSKSNEDIPLNPYDPGYNPELVAVGKKTGGRLMCLFLTILSVVIVTGVAVTLALMLGNESSENQDELQTTTNKIATIDPEETTSEKITSFTNIEFTTENVKTTGLSTTGKFEISKTTKEITTEFFTTTGKTTTDIPTSFKKTTTEIPTTIEKTTTDIPTTTAKTTTDIPTTIEKTTTDIIPTTTEKTTTDISTTIEKTTTYIPTTTEKTTTDIPTTIEKTTTDIPTTIEKTTTDIPTTIENTTTYIPTTIENTTTDIPTTIEKTTTDIPTTIEKTTTYIPTTIEKTTTDIPTTIEKTTTDIPTTIEKTTTEIPTTIEKTTTDNPTTIEKTTTDILTTTDKATTGKSTTKPSTLPPTTVPITFAPSLQPPIVSETCDEPSGNVGSCADFDCTTDNGEIMCTQVLETETLNITCGGETFTMISETACQCISCGGQKFYINVKGSAYGNTSNDPLMFGVLYLNEEKVAKTNNLGEFKFELERYKLDKITLVAKDEYYNNFMATTQTFSVANDLSVMKITIVMSVKDNTLQTTTAVDNTIDFSKPGSETPVLLDIPANSFTFPNGSSYDGELSIDYSFMNTNTSEDLNKTPKSFMTEGGNTRLESYGMFKLSARTPDGDALDTKAIIRIPKSALNLGDAAGLKLWSFNETSGEWDFESEFEEEGTSRLFGASTREENFLVGSITVSADSICNLDREAPHPYCYVKVRVFDDETQTKHLGGVIVNAIYQGSNGEWLSYFTRTTSTKNGACMQVPCDDYQAVKETYFTASYNNDDLFALSRENLVNSDLMDMTDAILNSFSYEVDDQTGNSFSLIIKANSVDNANGPEYAESGHPCDDVDSEDGERYFGFYVHTLDAKKYVDMNAIGEPQNELSMPDSAKIPQCLSWWPNFGYYTACYIKVQVTGTNAPVTLQTINIGGTMDDIKDQWIGTRYAETQIDTNGNNYACVEYKCTDNISPSSPGASNNCDFPYDTEYIMVNPTMGDVDRTKIRVEPVGTSCTINWINADLINDLTNDKNKDDYVENNNGDQSFYFYDSEGLSNYGIYTEENSPNPEEAKNDACFKCNEISLPFALNFDCS